MNTNRTTRLTGLVLAIVITAALQGAMLWKFDAVAQEATLAAAATQNSSVASSRQVSIAAPHS